MMRTCNVCGTEFESRYDANQCSKECRWEHVANLKRLPVFDLEKFKELDYATQCNENVLWTSQFIFPRKTMKSICNKNDRR